MTLAPGTHKVGPQQGTLHVHTYRDGVAQKIGHDLILAVDRWEGMVEVVDGGPARVELDADSQSLQVSEGVGGAKPLSDDDKKKIIDATNDKVLKKQPIKFHSSSVTHAGGKLTLAGDLTMGGTTRPASFDLALADDGHLTGKLEVVQSEWGIKPYKAMMGALKVKDTVEIVLDVTLPAG